MTNNKQEITPEQFAAYQDTARKNLDNGKQLKDIAISAWAGSDTYGKLGTGFYESARQVAPDQHTWDQMYVPMMKGDKNIHTESLKGEATRILEESLGVLSLKEVLEKYLGFKGKLKEEYSNALVADFTNKQGQNLVMEFYKQNMVEAKIAESFPGRAKQRAKGLEEMFCETKKAA
jgi:hypothetical protein